MSMFSYLRPFGKRRQKGHPTGNPRKARREREHLRVEPLEKRELLNNDTPFIRAVTPLDNTAVNTATPTITIQFSETMDTTSTTAVSSMTNPANYILAASDGSVVPLTTATASTTTVANDTVTLAFTGGLPVNQYTVFVRGDHIKDVDDGRTLSDAGQLIVANSGRNDVSTAAMTGNGTVGALSNYALPPAGATAANPVAVKLADVTGDGLPDLVAVNAGTNQVDIFQGHTAAAGGGFSQTPDLILDLPVGASPKASSLVIADLHEDLNSATANHLLDIAVADFGTNNVAVFLNNRTAPNTLSFATATTYVVNAAAVGPTSLVAADLNGDGFNDLAVANSAAVVDVNGDTVMDYTAGVLLGLSATPGTFSATATLFRVGDTAGGLQAPTGIASGIFSNSGKTDLVLSGGNNVIAYLQNTTATGAATPTFAGVATQNTAQTTTSITVGSLGNNPNPSIIVTTAGGGGQVLYFTTNGGPAPAFTLGTPITGVGTNPTAVSLADVDGNGLNDILVTNNNAAGTVTVVLNTTNAPAVSFLAPFSYAVGGNPQGLALADTTGDGRADVLVTANNSSNTVSLLTSTETTVSGDVTGATNTSPIIITTSGAVPPVGSLVTISGVGGNIAANGTWVVSAVTLNSFTLAGSNGITSGVYTSGGTWVQLPAVGTITGASNPGTITITSNNSLSNNSYVTIRGVGGNTNANGTFQITNVTPTQFQLLNSSGNGAYTGGGTWISPDNLFRISSDLAIPGTSPTPDAIAVGDLNSDGLPDYVVANRGSSSNGGNNVYVFLSSGLDAITGQPLYRAPFTLALAGGGTTPVSVAIGDLNNDGHPDIVVADQSGGSTGRGNVTVFTYTGNGSVFNAASYTPSAVSVGQNPTGIALGDFNGDGFLDLAVAHNRGGGGGGGGNRQGVTIVLNGLGNATPPSASTPFAGQTGSEPAGTNTPAVAVAVGDFNRDGRLDFVLANGGSPGQVKVFLGNGDGTFASGGTFSTGVTSPNAVVVADLNLDGYADIIVASGSTSATTGGVAALLNQSGTTFGTAIITPVLSGTGLASLAVTHVNEFATPGTPDVFPDIIVGAASGNGGSTIDNLFTLAGNGDGTFRTATAYLAGGTGSPTLPSSYVAATPGPLVRALTFTSGGSTVRTDLISNGNFELFDLSGEQGNLNGWLTYDLAKNPGSQGQWSSQTSTSSPLSGVAVPAPLGRYQAMLDEADQIPIPLSGGGGGGPPPNPNPDSSYAGSHALYQDVIIPAGATTVTLTYSLFINNFATSGGNALYASPSDLDFTDNTPNQQVRIDILDPTNPNQNPNPLNPNFLAIAGPGFLGNVFVTQPGQSATQTLINQTFDLSSFANPGTPTFLRLRFATANNRGKLIVGVDNVHITALFTDITPPVISGLTMRNPGFTLTGAVTGASSDGPIVITTSAAALPAVGSTVTITGVTGNTAANGTFKVSAVNGNTFTIAGSAANSPYTGGGTWTDLTPHTTDPTIVGRVSDNGSINNLSVIAFDVNNNGSYDDPQDFKINTWDAQGNFSFTISTLGSGFHTVGVAVLDKANSNGGAITDASNNGGPIVITTTAATLPAVGNYVGITGVTGNLAANGTFQVIAVSGNTFTLANSAGNGTYTGGGSWLLTTPISFDLQGNSNTEWRAFGPNSIDVTNQNVNYTKVSGRVTVVVTDPRDLSGNSYFVGAANGGVWKTTDGGSSWKPTMDFLTDLAGNPEPAPIGGLAIATSGTSIVMFAGTGVADTAFDSRPGVGVFKSVDGGNTWFQAGNSGTVLGGARISKMVVAANNPNIIYAAVASGGVSGPGVYRSTDGGATWVNVMTPAAMGLAPSALLASVTDLVIDPNNPLRLVAGLGNVGLVPARATAGVWRSTDGGNTWTQPIGGAVVNIGVNSYNVPNSTLPNGINLGKVTVAISSKRVGNESTVYILIGTPPGNNTPPNVDLGTFSGLYKTSNNFLDFTKVMLRQDTPGAGHNYQNINLFGEDASYVGALTVDPTNPNVVYVGGSTLWTNTPNDPLAHALVRVDTGNMRDASFVYNGAIPNDGDDRSKYSRAANQSFLYDPPPGGLGVDPYTGEGVYWYDLIEQVSTSAPGNNRLTLLPPEIHALTFDAQGRLLIGTEGGIWRAVNNSYGYDFTSNGNGIIRAGGGGGGGPRTFSTPGSVLTSINGNLQISDLTSVAIDPVTPGVLFTTQAGTGTALSTSPLQWISGGLTGPTIAGTNLEIPTAGVVVAGAPPPGSAPGTPTTLYRVWQFANASALQPEVSTDGGNTWTPMTGFLSGSQTGGPGYIPGGMFPTLALNPVKVQTTGSLDQLLFGTSLVYETLTSGNAWDSVPASATSTPSNPVPLAANQVVTAVAFAATPPGGTTGSSIFYAGTDQGEVFTVNVNTGGNWVRIDGGALPFAKVNSITVDPNNSNVVYVTFFSSVHNSVWRGVVIDSTTGATNWTNISLSLPSVPAYALVDDPRTTGGATNGRLYVATEVGVFASTDLGTNWVRLGQGMPNVPVVGLQFDSSLETLAAATQGRGAFTISTALIGPRIIGINDALGQNGVTIAFNKAIDPSTLTTAAFTIVGPSGVIPASDITITNLDPVQNNSFQLVFPATSPFGSYILTIQSVITDSAGNRMDQNQNGINGETPGDTYTGRFIYQSSPNTAPVLGVTATSMPTIRENEFTNQGVDLLTFTNSLNITDSDPGALKGIAITGVDNSNGAWQYSTNGGATWINIPALPANNGFLLEGVANNRIRFLPNLFFAGVSVFSYSAWDLTSGLNPLNGSDALLGAVVPAGGSHSISGNSGVANITVLLVNQPPTFTPGPNVTVLEDSGASAAAWATNLGPGAPNENGQVLNFIVTGNSNPGLFAAGPTFDAAGDLFFTPAANANGVASIFVVLHDNGGTVNGGNDTSAQVVFTIAVTPVNDQPSFTAGPNVGVFEDSGAYAAPWASNISTGPANENNEVVTFQVVGDSNPALFAAPPFVDQAGNLFFTPAANANGSAVITVQMLDDGGTANGGANLTAPQTFTIFVVPVNDAPSFTPGPTVSVLQSGGPQTFPGWATDLLAGPPDEAGQGLSFVVLGNSNPAVIANVTLDAAGNLTVTPAAGAVGSAVITVALKDNGDTANGGVDTSAPVSFTVTIIAINQPPSFFRGPDVSATRDAGLVVLPGWAAGIVAGPPNEAGQAVDFIVSNNNPTLFLVQPTVAPDGTLTFAPTGAGGSAIVTVQLHDNGGTANGGIDTSAPQQFTITVSGTGFRGTPNEAYVVETYFDLLDRIISPGDLAFWVDQLEADVPRLTIATQIVNSPEYRSKQIAHLYQSLLNKDPSPADLFPHLQYLGAGHTSEELRSVFLSSPAYIHGHGQSNEFAWVNAIFMDEFGHGANLSGQQYWVTQLRNSGYDFFNTALAIITTPEGYGTVVRQLYVNLLGHPVDPSAGLNPWFVALQNGMRDEDVIAGINSSLEYFQHQSPHWSVPGLQSWVSHMYVDTLGRVVDPNGLSFWVGAMERGASRIDIMQQVVHSGEFLTHEINNVYQQLLHRVGDPAGINIGLQLLGSGGTVEQLKAQLMGSAEYYFVRGGGTDAGFLTSVLSDALSMPPAQAFAGVGFWANVLAGTTRDNVALQILTDPNAEQALVQNMYFSLLRRSGGAGLAYWAGQIEAGMRDESVIANLVASREYYTKFSAG